MKFCIKNFILTYKSALLLYFFATLSIWAMLTAFCSEANIDQNFNKINIARNIGDACFLTSIFWILPSRKRWLMILPIASVGIFCLINLWYYRFWNDILPVSCLTMTENVNGLLINSIRGLLTLNDCIYILPTLVYIYIYRRYSRQKDQNYCQFSKRIRCASLISSILCFLLAQAGISESYRRWELNSSDNYLNLYQATKQRITTPPFRANWYYKTNGMIIHSNKIISMYFELRHMSKSLSLSEQNDVFKYIDANNLIFSNSSNEIFSSNKNKNIIFIIAESLNANVINRQINNTEVTPTLNNLTKSEGSIATISLASQIHEGGSGDGQMIYNSGILPLAVGATPLHLTYKTHLYPLPSQLGRNTVAAVFSGSATSWKERQNFANYGFKLISTEIESATEISKIGHDAAMFERGQQLIATANQPFFLELITESMHAPFQDEGVSGHNWIFNDSLLESVEANYLRMCAYFDHQLGLFIDFLKEKGLYENTILIIASDHSQSLAMASKSRLPDSEIPIVFIAANTGMTKQITKPVGQIDVFPTILQIAGVENPEFAGVGTSMLDSINHTDMETAQKISELILRGNYFGSIKD